jgi:hypothetical protein
MGEKAPISGGAILRIDQAATPYLFYDWSIGVDDKRCKMIFFPVR